MQLAELVSEFELASEPELLPKQLRAEQSLSLSLDQQEYRRHRSAPLREHQEEPSQPVLQRRIL